MKWRAVILATVLPGLLAWPVSTIASTPAPSTCQTEPVPIERLAALLATPIASTPLADQVLEGTPPDDDIAHAVEETILEVFACLNAGEPLRAYGLYTDNYLRAILAHETPETLRSLATPSPADRDEWTTVLAIRDIRLLDDGRVYATVILDPALIPVEKTFGFFLIEQDGRWLVDDVLDELEFSLP